MTDSTTAAYVFVKPSVCRRRRQGRAEAMTAPPVCRRRQRPDTFRGSRDPLLLPPGVADSITAIREHLAELETSGYRPSSIAGRWDVLMNFHRFVAPKPLTRATRADMLDFLGRPLSLTTRRYYLTQLRGFYGWCAALGLVERDETLTIRTVRVPRMLPRPISTSDLTRAIENGDARMRAWLLLMSLAGLRGLEVAALRPQDLFHTEFGPILYLRETKGGGDATVPAHPHIVEALDDLLVYPGGVWWSVGHDRLRDLINLHLRELGIDATAHQLRHYAGTAWYEASGRDLVTTAALMRHANIQCTMGYAALPNARTTEVVNAVTLALR
jgi:integrase/recombinase XerD